MTKTFLAPSILRHILNKTGGVRFVRSMAAQLPNMPPTYYPSHHLTVAELEEHVKASEVSGGIKLLSNWPNKSIHQELMRTDQFTFWSIMDYSKMYKSGHTTPSEQMERVLKGCEKLSHLKIYSSHLSEDVRQ
eukprot:CAMPEP_0194070178 /NCGR_PEP_ID=MMETSP0009_2-20130614/88046_1 /TAXON_ID=210454 /ORGANISM="Grammatophora oceanica, Strain CCMP 410" /LENGTH=132 /DNA_ID=CAMNT_0038723435 /DNA_START=1109 /DNA_END=1504 /DNA_ORIENTATION=+